MLVPFDGFQSIYCVSEVLGSFYIIQTEIHSITTLVEREGWNRLLQVPIDYLEWYTGTTADSLRVYRPHTSPSVSTVSVLH